MNYSYVKFFSITDVVIVLAALIMIFIGFKKGFLIKALEISRKFCGLIVALLFSVKFANGVLYPLFGHYWAEYFYNNISSNESIKAISDKEGAIATLKNLGIPEFISKFVIDSQNIDTSTLADSIANNIASLVTTVALVVIAFIILWLGTKLVFWILKLFAKLLRTSTLIKIVDGVLGVVLQAIILYIVLQVLMFVVILIFNKAGIEQFNLFVTCDIKGLASVAGFNDRGYTSISSWLFSNNLIGNLISLLF